MTERPRVYGEATFRSSIDRHIKSGEELLDVCEGVKKRIAAARRGAAGLAAELVEVDWTEDVERWRRTAVRAAAKHLADNAATTLPTLTAGWPPDTGKPRHARRIEWVEPWLRESLQELAALGRLLGDSRPAAPHAPAAVNHTQTDGTAGVATDSPQLATHAPAIAGASPNGIDRVVLRPSAFISYAHEDKELAANLAAALRVRGCRVWIDQGEMRVGDRLIERIAGAIGEMEVLLAIVSPASVESAWCRREVSLAISGEFEQKQIKVLPVRLGGVALPPTLKGIFSPQIDATDVAGMADRLLADMTSHRAGQA